MSNITYPAKPVAGNGTSEYVEGQSLPAAELQADFDAIATVVNGDLDEDNLSSGTQIPNSKLVDIDGTKVVDHSDSATTAALATSPGDSATLGSNLATNNEGELERLRYRIGRNTSFPGAQYRNSSGTDVDVAWVEPPIVGPNRLANSGFEVFTGSSGDAPDGWTEVGTITTSAIEAAATAATGADKRSLALTMASSGGGISQTVSGLRASTKYLFGVRYFRTSGTVAVSTTGGLGSGNYQNPTISDNSTSGIQTVQIVVQTDTSGTDMVFRVLSGASSTDFNVVSVWCYELNEDFPGFEYSFPVQEATVSSEVTNVPATVNSATDWATNWTDIPSLDLSQYVPTQGLRLIYEVRISWASVLNDSQSFFGFRLELDDGSTSIVDGPYVEATDTFGTSEVNQVSSIRLVHVVDNPTPGSTYTFTPQVTAADSAAATGQAPRLHPLISITSGGATSVGSNGNIQTESKARLRVERI